MFHEYGCGFEISPAKVLKFANKLASYIVFVVKHSIFVVKL